MDIKSSEACTFMKKKTWMKLLQIQNDTDVLYWHLKNSAVLILLT